MDPKETKDWKDFEKSLEVMLKFKRRDGSESSLPRMPLTQSYIRSTPPSIIGALYPSVYTSSSEHQVSTVTTSRPPFQPRKSYFHFSQTSQTSIGPRHIYFTGESERFTPLNIHQSAQLPYTGHQNQVHMQTQPLYSAALPNVLPVLSHSMMFPTQLYDTRYSFGLYPKHIQQQPKATEVSPCELCPSPSAFNQEDEESEEIHKSSHEMAMFQCAGCGIKMENYAKAEEHVESDHVGRDIELIRASIVIPTMLEHLRVYQCGIKSCGRRFVAQPDSALKKHIRTAHGEFYIHMGKGRNILRLCRICEGEMCYESDQALNEHLLSSHPPSIYANSECLSILPGSQKIPVLLNRHPQPRSPPTQVCKFVERRKISQTKKIDQDENDADRRSPTRVERTKLSSKNEKSDDDISRGRERENDRKRLSRKESNLDRSYDSMPKVKKRKKTKKVAKGRKRSASCDSTSSRKSKHRRIEAKSCEKIKKKKKKKKEKKDVPKYEADIEDENHGGRDSHYCNACDTRTQDWNSHKFSFIHINNDKKARCLFCPQRLWFPQLKNHIRDSHRGASFVCNASDKCFIRLMDLAKIVDHINTKHRKELEPLYKMTGQTGFISPHLLSKHSLMILPADLRKISCRICDTHYLGQGQDALEKHFQQDHPHVKRVHYESNIMYECRACDGLLFGSLVYLNQHFKEIHCLGGFKPGRAVKETDWKELKDDVNANTPRESFLSRNIHGHRDDEIGRRRSRSVESSIIANDGDNMGREKTILQGRSGIDRKRSTPRCSSPWISGWRSTSPPSHAQSPLQEKIVPTDDRGRQLKEPRDKLEQHKMRDILTQCQADEMPILKRESCLFCDKTLPSKRLEEHFERKHNDLLFSCDDFCPKEFKAAWKSEVITHLKIKHDRLESDEILSRHYVRMPVNLMMVVCKIKDCEDAVYFGRLPLELSLDLQNHMTAAHSHLSLNSCFSLACRGCGLSLDLDEVEEWTKHVSLDHRVPDFPKRIRCISSSSMEYMMESSPRKEHLTSKPRDLVEDFNDSDVSTNLDVQSDINLEEYILESESNDDYLCKNLQEKEVLDENKNPEDIKLCKFCLDQVEPKLMQLHFVQNHKKELLKCHLCHETGKEYFTSEIMDLGEHYAKDHDETLSAQEINLQNLDMEMNVCKICNMDLYTGDPVILATHLLEHDLGPDLSKFTKHCRKCDFVDSIGGNEEQTLINGVRHHGSRLCILSAIKEDRLVKKDEQIEHGLNQKGEMNSIANEMDQDMEGQFVRKICTEQKDENCNFCEEFVPKSSLEFHIRTEHKKNTFFCTICLRRGKLEKSGDEVCFETISEAGEHMKNVHDIQIPASDISRRDEHNFEPCQLYPTLKSVYYLGLPASFKMYQCPVCKRNLLSESVLRKHSCWTKSLDLTYLLTCRFCLRGLSPSEENDHIKN